MNVYQKPYKLQHMTRSRADHFTAVVARALLGGFFVYSAIDNYLNLSKVADSLNMSGAVLLVLLGATIKFTLGLMVVFRYHTKYAALGLAIYLIVTNLVLFGPNTWSENVLKKYIFMRNIAIIGGLLFVDAYSRGWKEWKEDFFDKDPYKEYKEAHPDVRAPKQLD